MKDAEVYRVKLYYFNCHFKCNRKLRKDTYIAYYSNFVQQGVTKGGEDLTGYKKRTADRGVEKIQEDLLNLQEAYQFLMKKYRYIGSLSLHFSKDINIIWFLK